MPVFRKQPPQTTYLECYSDNGWVYLVIGQAGRYSVELHKGSQCFVMAAYSDLPRAQKAALWLLDNGAEPDDLRRKKADALRKQPCI